MKTKAIKTGMLVGAVALAANLMGCSLHTTWGARDVGFDYSDHAYYDKSFAPSSLAASHAIEEITPAPAGTNEQAAPNTETTR